MSGAGAAIEEAAVWPRMAARRPMAINAVVWPAWVDRWVAVRRPTAIEACMRRAREATRRRSMMAAAAAASWATVAHSIASARALVLRAAAPRGEQLAARRVAELDRARRRALPEAELPTALAARSIAQQRRQRQHRLEHRTP